MSLNNLAKSKIEPFAPRSTQNRKNSNRKNRFENQLYTKVSNKHPIIKTARSGSAGRSSIKSGGKKNQPRYMSPTKSSQLKIVVEKPEPSDSLV